MLLNISLDSIKSLNSFKSNNSFLNLHSQNIPLLLSIPKISISSYFFLLGLFPHHFPNPLGINGNSFL